MFFFCDVFFFKGIEVTKNPEPSGSKITSHTYKGPFFSPHSMFILCSLLFTFMAQVREQETWHRKDRQIEREKKKWTDSEKAKIG